MELNITCIPGDGIDRDRKRSEKVLDKVAECYGHQMKYTDILMGSIHRCAWSSVDGRSSGDSESGDAVLMGSIGGNTTTSPWYQLLRT